jgi:hypothetical protein
MQGNELTEILSGIIANLESEGINLQETPALFKWRHPQHNEYEFHLLIKIVDANDVEEQKYVH